MSELICFSSTGKWVEGKIPLASAWLGATVVTQQIQGLVKVSEQEKCPETNGETQLSPREVALWGINCSPACHLLHVRVRKSWRKRQWRSLLIFGRQNTDAQYLVCTLVIRLVGIQKCSRWVWSYWVIIEWRLPSSRVLRQVWAARLVQPAVLQTDEAHYFSLFFTFFFDKPFKFHGLLGFSEWMLLLASLVNLAYIKSGFKMTE